MLEWFFFGAGATFGDDRMSLFLAGATLRNVGVSLLGEAQDLVKFRKIGGPLTIVSSNAKCVSKAGKVTCERAGAR